MMRSGGTVVPGVLTQKDYDAILDLFMENRASARWFLNDRAELPVPPQPTILYRFFGAEDRLLYVGITKVGPGRWGQHAAEKSWWPEVSRVDVQHFPNRVEALLAEAKAIRDENPIHNIAGKDQERTLAEDAAHIAGKLVVGDRMLLEPDNPRIMRLKYPRGYARAIGNRVSVPLTRYVEAFPDADVDELVGWALEIIPAWTPLPRLCDAMGETTNRICGKQAKRGCSTCAWHGGTPLPPSAYESSKDYESDEDEDDVA